MAEEEGCVVVVVAPDHYYLDGEIHNNNNNNNIASLAFHSFGVLELILSYAEASDLLAATQVNKRWKQAGRTDSLWKDAIKLLWKDKVGVNNHHHASHHHDDDNDEDDSSSSLLFWRSLFTKDAVQRMTETQIRSIFRHPLLTEKEEALPKETPNNQQQLQRFLQLHMLDVMSDGSERHTFFSDIYFGSYTCSFMDSKREVMTQAELCTSHGFDMYFKVSEEEVDEPDRALLTNYEDEEGLLLYHHSTCFLEESRNFQIVLKQHVNSYHPTDLRWRWLDVGKSIQVGPYPPLHVHRRKDWGWKLENLHVVLVFRDH